MLILCLSYSITTAQSKKNIRFFECNQAHLNFEIIKFLVTKQISVLEKPDILYPLQQTIGCGQINSEVFSAKLSAPILVHVFSLLNHYFYKEIQDFRMGRVSGMEISSSQGLKKPPKISPREETLSSQGPQARGRLEFPSHGLILRFFSTRGMKKFLYLKPKAHLEIVFLQELTKQNFCFT